MSDIAKEALRPCPRCEGILFLNAGLRVLVNRRDYQTTQLGRQNTRGDWENHETVYVCAGCLCPIIEDNGQVISLADEIDQELVAVALLRGGYQIPALRRQETKAASDMEERGYKD